MFLRAFTTPRLGKAAGKTNLKLLLTVAAGLGLGTVFSSYIRIPKATFATRLILGWGKSVRREVEPGVSLRLDPHDFVQKQILIDGEWEPQIWRPMSALLPEGGVLLDVGAHIGYYSLKGSVKVGKRGQVIAFEPNPATVQLLRDNLEASKAQNVTVQPVACTDREQMLTLYAGPEKNIGITSLSRENVEVWRKISGENPKTIPTFTVRGRPIDGVVRELGSKRVDAIKIDVEGAEYYVLRGAVDTLKRFHPAVFIELVPRQLAGMHTTVEQVIGVLKEAGYNRSRQLDDSDWEWTRLEQSSAAKEASPSHQ